MAAESEDRFVARARRQRRLFSEINTVGSADDVIAIDAMRRGTGRTTQLGDAIRGLYLREEGNARRDQMRRVFDRPRTPSVAPPVAPAAPPPESSGGGIGGFLGRVADVADIATFSPEDVAGAVASRAGDVLGPAVQRQARTLGGLLEDIARPGGALIGALGGETPRESLERLAQGWMEPAEVSGRDVGFVRHFSDNDIIGPLSPRDFAGGAAEVLFDPIDLLFGGLLITDVVRGARKGARALGDVRRARRAVPETPIQNVLDEIVPGEDVGKGLIQRYEGQVNAQGLGFEADLDFGNDILRGMDIGRQGVGTRTVERSDEMVALFKTLHGEGEIPAGMEPVVREIRRQLDVELVATQNFDPKFMAHPDYFPRGWWQPTGAGKAGPRTLGGTAGFQRPRIDATFSEMLAAGMEPVSWNPFEMAALRRVAGAEFREQRSLVRYMRELGQAVPVEGGHIPDGFRIPQVGPAFEGAVLQTAEGQTLRTTQYAVADNLATRVEAQFGTGKPSLGKISSLEIVDVVTTVGGAFKRAKLFGSFFQQMDFATRTAFATFGGAADSLLAGRPIQAVTRLARLPRSLGELAFANVSPARRQLLREQILSGDAILSDRPGISLRGIAEGGWRQTDLSILPRDINQSLRAITNDSPRWATPQLMAKAKDRVLRMETAMQNGLFDGVYPQAQITALKNFIVPRIARQHPDWTDAQIMANAATEVNKMFSTLGDFQTFFQSRGGRTLMRNLFFSTNESESLIRSAFSAIGGPNKALWGEFWIGGATFLALTANAIHKAATGDWLPIERYQLLERGGPLGVRYNDDFVSPTIPMLGRGGAQIQLDLMGQMDTVLRFLDPLSAVTSRFSVPARAALNQARGSDFFGRPLDTRGERVQQFIADVGLPIGTGNILGALGIGPENEGRLGEAGLLIQGTGINLRAESTPELLERIGIERGTEPRDRLRILEENPEVREELDRRRQTSALRGSEGAQLTIDIEEARDTELAKQVALDAELDAGRRGAERWRDQRRLNQTFLRGQTNALFGETDPDPDTPRGRLAIVINESELPTGEVDWDRVDAWLGQQSQADQAEIIRNTGLTDTPLEREYRSVLARADRRNYFDFGTTAWSVVQRQAPVQFRAAIAPFGSYGDWYLAAINQLATQMGLPEGVGRQKAKQLLERHPVVQAYRSSINHLQKLMIDADPRLAEDLAKWDLLTTQETERRFITQALQ